MDTILILFIVFCVVSIVIWIAKAVARSQAKAAYQQALAILERNPTDGGARKRALRLGRAYSNLMRDGEGETLFDEVAVRNDMDAVSGGKTEIVGGTPPRSHAAPPALENRLADLKNFRDNGLISEEEYAAKRRGILDRV